MSKPPTLPIRYITVRPTKRVSSEAHGGTERLALVYTTEGTPIPDDWTQVPLSPHILKAIKSGDLEQAEEALPAPRPPATLRAPEPPAALPAPKPPAIQARQLASTPPTKRPARQGSRSTVALCAGAARGAALEAILKVKGEALLAFRPVELTNLVNDERKPGQRSISRQSVTAAFKELKAEYELKAKQERA